MTTYVSLLRGINVSGHKMIRMMELVAMYESLGFQKIRTYLQSGNVVFESSKALSAKLAKAIEDKILQTFGFPVSVILREKEDLHRIIRSNPFLGDKALDVAKLHVTFLLSAPFESACDKMKEIRGEPDAFFLADKEVYLFCQNGYGRTKLSNNFFEKKLSVIATTRNWNSVRKLYDLANE